MSSSICIEDESNATRSFCPPLREQHSPSSTLEPENHFTEPFIILETPQHMTLFTWSSRGGILVLQTTALVILLQSYRVFQDFLKTSASLFLFFTEYQSARSSEASWISTVVEDGVLQSSCQHAQRKVGVSSQFTFGIHEVDTKRPFAGTLAFRAHQFSLVLATVDASDEARGILLETDLKTTMEIESSKHKVSFDLSSFTILGLHPYGKVTNGKDRADLVPHFGSSSLASCSGDTKELVGCALPSADGTLTGSNASITSKDQVFQEKHSKRSPRRRDRDSNGKDCYILESMTVSFSIERTLAGIELGSWKWRDAWNGQCSISGVDLAFTTSEILANYTLGKGERSRSCLLHLMLAPSRGIMRRGKEIQWKAYGLIPSRIPSIGCLHVANGFSERWVVLGHNQL
eukprot:Gb_10941 [translate_table: standard]